MYVYSKRQDLHWGVVDSKMLLFYRSQIGQCSVLCIIYVYFFYLHDCILHTCMYDVPVCILKLTLHLQPPAPVTRVSSSSSLLLFAVLHHDAQVEENNTPSSHSRAVRSGLFLHLRIVVFFFHST